jgi:hypothetical protein
MKTIIKAKKDLYNKGLCFTKGNLYEVNGHEDLSNTIINSIPEYGAAKWSEL